MSVEGMKKTAAIEALKLVEDGMTVGLGTGSTMKYLIMELGRLVEGGLEVRGVPTSYQSMLLAVDCGVPVTSLDVCPVLDLAFDGADEVAGFFAVKGGGGAHTREKIVASSARRFILVVDETKVSSVLSHPVPLEVIPMARCLVEREVRKLGGRAVLRQAVRKDGPVITDGCGFILDVDFGRISDPVGLSTRLSSIPGVVEHGIFTRVDGVFIGKQGGVEIKYREG